MKVNLDFGSAVGGTTYEIITAAIRLILIMLDLKS